MKIYVDGVTGRLVTVQNADSSNFIVQRIVANDSPENASCNDYPNKALTPGASYTGTFLVCGPVHKIRIETDLGSQTLQVGVGS